MRKSPARNCPRRRLCSSRSRQGRVAVVTRCRGAGLRSPGAAVQTAGGQQAFNAAVSAMPSAGGWPRGASAAGSARSKSPPGRASPSPANRTTTVSRDPPSALTAKGARTDPGACAPLVPSRPGTSGCPATGNLAKLQPSRSGCCSCRSRRASASSMSDSSIRQPYPARGSTEPLPNADVSSRYGA
jgi:hypothetical protein